MRSWSTFAVVLVAAVGLAAVGPAAAATAADRRSVRPDGGIGIRLLDAPVSRRADPRAHRYIIDHLKPGSVIERRVVVANLTSKRHTVAVSAGGAVIKGNEFQPRDGHPDDELPGWVTFDRARVDLAPGAERPVKVHIQVPRTAWKGERYGVIWASIGAGAPRRPGIALVNRVEVRIYLDIGPGGEPRPDFTIGDFVARRAADGRPSVEIQVSNTGGRALDMSGQLRLSDGPAGSRAGPFQVSNGLTLPKGGSGAVTVGLPADLPNGPWLATVELASGQVRRAAKARITFPDPGGQARSAHPAVGSALTLAAALVAGAALVTLGLLVLRARRRRSSSGV